MTDGRAARVVPFKMWDRINNFGDAINPHIIKLVSGLEPVKAGRVDHVIGIGSVLQKANERSFVWGSGLMHPHMGVRAAGDRIRAVRGRRTLEILRGEGILAADVPLGDPGFLVGRFADRLVNRGTERRYRAAVVPHHASQDDPVFKALSSSLDVKIVNMRSTSLQILQSIQEADVILSQSLHGLVFAEALGRPNLWISSNATSDWCFKFEDWFSNTREPQLAPRMFPRKGPLDIDALAAEARLHDVAIDEDALIAAFPLECAIERDAAGLVGFEEGRARETVFVPTRALAALQGEPLFALPEVVRRKAERDVKLPARAYFHNWAETRYAVIGHDRYFDDAAIYAAVQAIMDKHSNVKFAFLKRSSQRTPAGEGKVSTYRGIDYIVGDDVVGPCVIARPDLAFSFVEGSTMSIFV
jgi:hypothetical protein